MLHRNCKKANVAEVDGLREQVAWDKAEKEKLRLFRLYSKSSEKSFKGFKQDYSTIQISRI